eukprot:929121-Prorocentrum_minimum.AAC.1
MCERGVDGCVRVNEVYTLPYSSCTLRAAVDKVVDACGPLPMGNNNVYLTTAELPLSCGLTDSAKVLIWLLYRAPFGADRLSFRGGVVKTPFWVCTGMVVSESLNRRSRTGCGPGA